MTGQRELESLLVDFFDQGPVQVADRVIEAALVAIDSNTEARRLTAPRRIRLMSTFRRLAVAAVFGLLAVAAALYFSRPPTQIGATPTPSVGARSSQNVGVVPSPTDSMAPETAPPTTPVTPSPTATSTATAGALIAYVRQIDKPVTAIADPSVSCRPVGEGPTCPVDRVWLIGTDGTGSRELVPDGTERQQLLGWSPDGKYVMYTETDVVYLFDVESGEPGALDIGCKRHCSGDAAPQFSSDGQALVFTRRDPSGGSMALATMDLASGQIVQLRSTSANGGRSPVWGWSPVWSPDRQQIVFTGDSWEADQFGDMNWAAFIVDANGANLRQVTPPSLDATDARWSPDGSRILFDSFTAAFGPYINTIRPDGSDLRPLMTDGNSLGGSWTPDGRILFVRRSFPSQSALWTMDADGANATELISADITGIRGLPNSMYSPNAAFWQPSGGAAIVPPPWNPHVGDPVGPPAPTP